MAWVRAYVSEQLAADDKKWRDSSPALIDRVSHDADVRAIEGESYSLREAEKGWKERRVRPTAV